MTEREIERERLIELLNKVGGNVLEFPTYNFIESLADYLLAGGVIVPPCKVGDKLKQNRNRYIEMIDTYLEEPHSISADWVELLRIMREIIEGEGQNES